MTIWLRFHLWSSDKLKAKYLLFSNLSSHQTWQETTYGKVNPHMKSDDTLITCLRQVLQKNENVVPVLPQCLQLPNFASTQIFTWSLIS